MRFLIGLVLLAALVPEVSAQHVRLKLHNGQTVQGQLLEVTDEAIEIQVGENIVKVGVNEVADFDEVEVVPEQDPPVTVPPGSDPPATVPPVGDPPVTVPPVTDPPVVQPVSDPPAVVPPVSDPPAAVQPVTDPLETDQDPPATPGGVAPTPKTSPVVTRSSRVPRNKFAERLGWIPERYTWVAPDSTPSLLSMLVLFFFVLGGSFHFSTRVANIEFRSFGRSLMLSFVVMLAAGMQIGFVPVNPMSLGCMVLGNTVVWMVLTAGLFQAPRFAAITMAVVTVLCLLVSFMVLEVVDSLMGMVDSGVGRDW